MVPLIAFEERVIDGAFMYLTIMIPAAPAVTSDPPPPVLAVGV